MEFHTVMEELQALGKERTKKMYVSSGAKEPVFGVATGAMKPIASLARRQVLVGDPGQLPPVVSVELERWSHDPSGPHIACPHSSGFE